MTNPAFWSATRLARALRARKLGALELFDLYEKRIAAFNPRLNALCVLDLEGGRKRARAADRVRGRKGPLHGLPMTVKESFDVAGMPTTWGLPEFSEHRARSDALAVARVKAAGANVFGKSNVPLLLADWQSFNAVYGTTHNPWDVSRTPGGSSGGAAAALAAGLTGLELGSDIGASIRAPAHYCGVYGHKPTWALCSTRGHHLPDVVAQSDIAVIGPLARSAEDLRLAFDLIAGPDEIDAAGVRVSLSRKAPRGIRGLRVAVMANSRVAEVDASVADEIERVGTFLAKRGAKVSVRARPEIDEAEAWRVYVTLLRAETSGRLSDEDFARWQARQQGRPADDPAYEVMAARGATIHYKDWLRVSNRRHQMRLAWAAFFQDWDVLLCPTASTAAFPQNQKGERWERMIEVNGGPQPSTQQMFWAGWSGAFYLPGTVAPIALTREGLPVGVQIVGPQYGDHLTIGVARLLEREYRAFSPPPGFD
jgi:amidase